MAHLYSRSAICCAINAQTPLAFTPKWICRRFVRLRFLGQEAVDEAIATSHRGLHHATPRLGVQTAPHGRESPPFCHVPGGESSALYYDGVGSGMGNAAHCT